MQEKVIYVVDDELKIRELIASYLLKEGYRVKTFENGLKALKAFNDDVVDMLIIDIMMPVMNGYDLCREIRKISSVPIIMVSAKDDEIDRILGLELGSDDYIAKPFSPRELMVRIKTIFRRIPKNEPKIIATREFMEHKDLKIFNEERKVIYNNIEINLTTKEYELFFYLVQNKNKVFNREQLISNIWGYDYIGETRTIDDLVKRLRKKIQSTGSKVEITTVWGFGYKICD